MIGLKPDGDSRPEPMGSEALSYCCVQPDPTLLISSYLLFEERTKQKLRFFLNFVCIVLCCFIRDCLQVICPHLLPIDFALFEQVYLHILIILISIS